jgi:hypothetical protein
MERKVTTTQIFRNDKEVNTRQSTNQTYLPQPVFINQTYQSTILLLSQHEKDAGKRRLHPWWVGCCFAAFDESENYDYGSVSVGC